MKVIVSGGGTGGHIYPALAFAKFAEEKYNAEVLFIGNESRMESKIVPASGRRFFGVKMQGLNRKNMLKNIAIPFKTLNAYRAIQKQMKQFQPDVVIGTGGYVTVPVLLAGKKYAKTVIFEPDMNPGKANHFLSSRVDTVLTGFESTCEKYKEAKEVLHLGNPITFNYQALDANVQFAKQHITFLGGSLGAECLNQLALAVAQDSRFAQYRVTVVTGERFFDQEREKFASFSNVTVKAYESNIAKLYEETTLLVSRSGASTVSEVIHKALPTIFIPSPHVANNEQYDNVQELVQDEACLVFEEHTLNQEEFLNTVLRYVTDEEKYGIMSSRLKQKVKVEKMYEILTQLFEK